MSTPNYVTTYEYTDNTDTYGFTGQSVGPDVSPKTKKLLLFVVTATSSATRALTSVTLDGSTNITGTFILFEGGLSGRHISFHLAEVAPTKTTADISVVFNGTMTNCAISVLYVIDYNTIPTAVVTSSPGSGTTASSVTLSMPHVLASGVAAIVNRTSAEWAWTAVTGTGTEQYDNSVESQSRSLAIVTAGGTGDHIIQATPSTSSATRVMMGMAFDHLPLAASLTADRGIYTLTGVDAALRQGWAVIADVGSYVYTGMAALFVEGKVLAADVGSYVYTGVAAALNTVASFLVEAGQYVLTGLPTRQSYNFIADVGSYVLTGLSNVMVRVTTSTKYLKARFAPHRLKGDLRNVFLRE